MNAHLRDRLQRVRWTRVALLFLAILLPLLVVGAVTEDLLEYKRFAFEAPLLLGIHAHASPLLDRASVILNVVGGWKSVLPVSAAILAWLWWRVRSRAVFFAVGVAGATAIAYVMKLVFDRPRPELWPRLIVERDASFPSGHATVSAALVVAVMFLAWRTRFRWAAVLLGVAWTLVVGMSRLYLGVHYPSDVVVGWLTGLAWVAGTHLVFERRR